MRNREWASPLRGSACTYRIGATAAVEGVNAGTGAPGAPGGEVGEVGPGGVAGVADEEVDGQTLKGVFVGEPGRRSTATRRSVATATPRDHTAANTGSRWTKPTGAIQVRSPNSSPGR